MAKAAAPAAVAVIPLFERLTRTALHGRPGLSATFGGRALAGGGYLKRLAFQGRDGGGSLERLRRLSVFGTVKMFERFRLPRVRR